MREAQLAVFERRADEVLLESNSEAVVLVLSGEPLGEAVVGHGPFVMNTRQEIVQAIDDFNTGRFGHLTPATG